MTGGVTRRLGRPPGPTRARELRREELLDAAESAIRGAGPAVSMEDIAAAAQVSKPVLYDHVGDKAQLSAALARRASTRLVASMNAALQSDAPPYDVLRASVAAFCDWVEHDQPLYRFLVDGPPEPGQTRRLVVEIAARIAAVLRERLAAVGHDVSDAEPWAFAIAGAVFFAAESTVPSGHRSRDAVVDSVTRLLWSGLAGALPDGATSATPPRRAARPR